MSAYALLQRNLLDTAVTQAKRLVVLVGNCKALAVAVRTAGTGRDQTARTSPSGRSTIGPRRRAHAIPLLI